MVFRNLRSGKDYVCSSGSENLLEILSKFHGKEGFPRDNISAENIPNLDSLIDAGILIDEKEFLKIQDELRSWNKYEWRDAMLYHYGSDKPGYIEPYVSDWETSRIETHEKYLRESRMPDIYKSHGGESTISIKGELLPLNEIDMMQLLLSRRTVRNFTGESVDLDTLYSIFYYATTSVRDIRKVLVQAMLDSDGICLLKQSEFTALEFYVIIHNCVGIAPGIYHFNLEHLTFDLLEEGEFRDEVKSIQMGQSVLHNSAFSMYIAIDFHKQMWRYRYAHKYRTLLIQIGKIAQDFITYALSFGIGSFMSPAIKDSEAENLLDLDPTHEGVGYFMSFGKFNARNESSYFFTNLPGKSEKDTA
ncbi:SagB/ThcOx family dehydrogenase [Candidatus Gracilibacteria bacterium]|nr:SagB/ThcOx family dehydrogenase [Candidatus Gracilibacteria bacterium]